MLSRASFYGKPVPEACRWEACGVEDRTDKRALSPCISLEWPEHPERSSQTRFHACSDCHLDAFCTLENSANQCSLKACAEACSCFYASIQGFGHIGGCIARKTQLLFILCMCTKWIDELINTSSPEWVNHSWIAVKSIKMTLFCDAQTTNQILSSLKCSERLISNISSTRNAAVDASGGRRSQPHGETRWSAGGREPNGHTDDGFTNKGNQDPIRDYCDKQDSVKRRQDAGKIPRAITRGFKTNMHPTTDVSIPPSDPAVQDF